MKKYNFLYTTDNNYFIHMLTSIYSLLENNKDIYLNIHIIEDNLSELNKNRLYYLSELYSNVKINIYSIKLIEDIMNKFNIPKWRNTNIANARLFANEIIKDVDIILYLDSDTIIDNNLKDVFNYNNSAIAAVKDITMPQHIEGKLNEYYNSGVLLFNYNIWENEHCIDKIYKILKSENDLIYPDQDLINLAIEDITTLSISYNIYPIIKKFEDHPFLAKRYYDKKDYFYQYKEIIEALKKPHIYHNLSYLRAKTWERNKVHPYNEIYGYYRKIWEPDFELDSAKSIYANSKTIDYINILKKSL